ncbi:hypothetical protein [Spirillospora sp. CA-294931]|uniref:hypothetical protein n=1 Tax=Spirillospora sp. CA-294931 TaxID=3240042 RepID=UPI003D89D6AE
MTVRGLLLAALFLLASLPGTASADPFPEYANRRLDRVAAALAKDPLFVDPDMTEALDAPGRTRVRRAVAAASRQIGCPVYVIVLPNPRDSEVAGDDEGLLFALRARTQRDGLYLLVNDHARFEKAGFGVPRNLESITLFDQEERTASPADRERPFRDLADRVTARLALYTGLREVERQSPDPIAPPTPFGEENRLEPEEPEIGGPLALGALLAGPVAAVVIFFSVAVVRRRTRAPGGEVYASDHRPSMRFLRRTGAGELASLSALLPENEENPAHSYAASAYDVARLLHDEAGEDVGRAIDLVGAIVLAREGRRALAAKDPAPRPACFVNPLHGPARRRKHVRLDGAKGKGTPRSLCDACHGMPSSQLAGRVLQVPGSDGPRPHYAIPGVWRDTAFGSTPNLVPRVQEYLGVS